MRFGPLRLNASKSGIGYSWGIPGIRVSTSPAGKRYLWLSIPGTGLAWSKEIGRSSPGTPQQRKTISRLPKGTKVKKAIQEHNSTPKVANVSEPSSRPMLDVRED
jgi:hypothetical protein